METVRLAWAVAYWQLLAEVWTCLWTVKISFECYRYPHRNLLSIFWFACSLLVSWWLVWIWDSEPFQVKYGISNTVWRCKNDQNVRVRYQEKFVKLSKQDLLLSQNGWKESNGEVWLEIIPEVLFFEPQRKP